MDREKIKKIQSVGASLAILDSVMDDVGSSRAGTSFGSVKDRGNRDSSGAGDDELVERYKYLVAIAGPELTRMCEEVMIELQKRCD